MTEYIKEKKPNPEYARRVDDILGAVGSAGGDDVWVVLPGMYGTVTVQLMDRCRIVMVHVTDDTVSYIGMRLNNQRAYGDECPWCAESISNVLKSLRGFQCPIMFDLRK